MPFDYEDGETLERSLYAAIHIFDDSRDAHFRNMEADPTGVFDVLEKLGEAMVRTTDELTVHESFEELYAKGGTLKSLLDELGEKFGERFRDLIVERVQIDLAFQFSTNVNAQAERCLELTEFLIDTRPTERVLKYVRRLTRCYIAGFLPECVILCRAVLENAILEAFARHRVPVPAAGVGKSPMAAQLEYALREGWLDADAKRSAWAIWKRGSKAAHEDIGATTDALGTIRATMGVVQQLYHRN